MKTLGYLNELRNSLENWVINGSNSKIKLKDNRELTPIELIAEIKQISLEMDLFNTRKPDNTKGKLIRHLPESSNIRKFAEAISEQCQFPVDTTLMYLLGVYSSVANMRYMCKYRDGTDMPIGLYLLMEQPPGAGKGYVESILTRPFNELWSGGNTPIFDLINSSLIVLKKQKETLEKEIKSGTETAFDEFGVEINKAAELSRVERRITELLKLKTRSGLFISDATPESIQDHIIGTRGFYAVVATEQEAAKVLMGLYSKQGATPNMSVIKSGFDGAHVTVSRVTREPFSGKVYGAMCVLAQYGTIDNMFKEETRGTGLSERYLCLSEDSMLGHRKNPNEVKPIPQHLLDWYRSKCEFINEIKVMMASTKLWDVSSLQSLTLCDDAWTELNNIAYSFEFDLRPGGKFEHPELQGYISKCKAAIAKLACDIFLLDRSNQNMNIVAKEYIEMAKGIYDELTLQRLRMLSEGLIIKPAMTETEDMVFSLFKSPHDSYTAQQVYQKLKGNTKVLGKDKDKAKEIVFEALESLRKQGSLFDKEINKRTFYSIMVKR